MKLIGSLTETITVLAGVATIVSCIVLFVPHFSYVSEEQLEIEETIMDASPSCQQLSNHYGIVNNSTYGFATPKAKKIWHEKNVKQYRHI